MAESFFSSPSSAILYLAGVYLLWSAVFETGRRHLRWVWRKVRKPPPPAPVEPEPQLEAPEEPAVVLGHPSAHLNLTPASELGEGEHRKLTMVAPEYLIENQDPHLPIRNVTTGVRTRDGRSHVFDAFYAPLLGAGRDAPVKNVKIPEDFLEDVHESAAVTAFLYWARFTRQRVRWEVVYDPNTRQPTYSEVPMPSPELSGHVLQLGGNERRFVIENTGDVRIEQVECELPGEATNWGLMTEVLAAWPLPALDPGQSQEIPLALAMGASLIEVTLRGRAEAVPYERKQVVSGV